MFRSAPDAVEVAAGTVLFTEGEPGDVMYALVDGHIDVTLHGAHLETLGPGSILGEMALVDASPRSSTAVAKEASRVVPVDRHRFTFLVHEHPTFALQVMGVMAERLRRANEHA